MKISLPNRLRGKIKFVIDGIKNKKSSLPVDDFDWNNYHQIYQVQMEDISHQYTQILKKGDYKYEDFCLFRDKPVLPLHPNHRLLYETILQLCPLSVIEIGCGWGDHLNNLKILCSNLDLYGMEISKEQIKRLKIRHVTLKANIEEGDITLPNSYRCPSVDVAYSQAVLMHIQMGNSHLVALTNMFKFATKQVVLVENWARHNFLKDIKNLFEEGMIPWESIYFYYRESIELKRPHLMMVSSTPLKKYSPILDYQLLRESVPKNQEK